jgi:hypothetical protein
MSTAYIGRQIDIAGIDIKYLIISFTTLFTSAAYLFSNEKAHRR